MADRVEAVFRPLFGKIAWQVKKGHGSFLTFEFGSPSLIIDEPVAPRSNRTDRENRALARRRITPRGEWHLWIYCCDWEIEDHGSPLAHSESPDAAINDAAKFLDGQILIAVSVAPDSSTTFQFDLGGVLKTSPWPEEEAVEQWMLYEPSGHVFTIDSSARYSHQLGNVHPDDQEHNALFESPNGG